jgi:cell wall-associated NlpC family hydrolase
LAVIGEAFISIRPILGDFEAKVAAQVKAGTDAAAAEAEAGAARIGEAGKLAGDEYAEGVTAGAAKASAALDATAVESEASGARVGAAGKRGAGDFENAIGDIPGHVGKPLDDAASKGDEAAKKISGSAEKESGKFASFFEKATNAVGGGFTSMGQKLESSGVVGGSGIARMGEKMTEAESKGGGLISSLASVGKVATVVTGAGLAVVGAEAIDLGNKYQSATTTLAASAGISIKAATNIGAAFLSTGGKTIFSAQQIMAAYTPVAAQIGQVEGHTLSAAQAMRVMSAAQDLAEGSSTDLATTTASLGSVMQTFHIGVGGVAAASDVLFNVSRLTDTSISSVAAGVDRLKSRLGIAAPSLQDTGALMDELAQHGVTGTKGISTVSTALTTLLSASAKTTTSTAAQAAANAASKASFDALPSSIQPLAKEMAAGSLTSAQQTKATKDLTVAQKDSISAYEKLSKAAGDVKAPKLTAAQQEVADLGLHVYTASGHFVGMRSVIEQLQPKLDKMSDQQKELAEKTLFGASSAQVFGQVLASGTKGYDSAALAVGKVGSAHEAAEKQTKTFAHQMELVKTQVEDLGTKLGLVLIPIVEKVVLAITHATEAFSKHKTTVEIVAGIIGTVLVAAIAAWVYEMGVAVAKSIAGMAEDIGKAVAWVATKVFGYGEVATAATASATEQQLSLFEVSATADETAGSQIAAGLSSAAGWVAAAATTLAGWVVSFAGMVAGAVSTAASYVASAATSAAGWVASAATAAASTAVAFAGMVAEAAVYVASAVAGAAVAAAAWIAANIPLLLTIGIFVLIGAAVVALVIVIVKNWTTIKDFILGVLDDIKTFALDAFHKIEDIVGEVVTWIKAHWMLIAAILIAPFAPLVLVILEVVKHWSTLSSAFSVFLSWLSGEWKRLGSLITEPLTKAWNDAKTIVSDAVGYVVDFVKSHWELLLAILMGPIGLAILWIKDHFHEISDAAKTVVDAIINFFTTLGPRAVTELDHMATSMLGKITKIASDALSWGSSIVTGIVQGIEHEAEHAADAIGNVGSGIERKFKSILHIFSPSAVMSEAGEQVVAGITQGVRMGGTLAQSAAEEVTNRLRMAFTLGMQRVVLEVRVESLQMVQVIRQLVVQVAAELTRMNTSWNVMVVEARAMMTRLDTEVTLGIRKLAQLFDQLPVLIATVWSKGWSDLANVATLQFNVVLSSVHTAWANLAATFVNGQVQLVAGWTTTWVNMRSAQLTAWTEIQVWFVTWWVQTNAYFQTGWLTINAYLVGAWATFRSWSQSTWTQILQLILDAWQTFTAQLEQQWQTLAQYFTNQWSSFQATSKSQWQTVTSGIEAAWNTLPGAAANMWSQVVANFSNGAGEVKSAMDRLFITPADAVLKVFGISIPQMASGGSVGPGFKTNGPRAIVGEGRPQYPEYVIPTDPQWRPNALRLIYEAMGDMQMLASGGKVTLNQLASNQIDVTSGKNPTILATLPQSAFTSALHAKQSTSMAALVAEQFTPAINHLLAQTQPAMRAVQPPVASDMGGYLANHMASGAISAATAAQAAMEADSATGMGTGTVSGDLKLLLADAAVWAKGHVPYVNGGKTMAGVDCSGLVQALYNEIGIPIGGDSFIQSAQGTLVGTVNDYQATLPKLIPGDGVYYSNVPAPGAGSSGHAVMYVGNGQVIQSSQPGQDVGYANIFPAATSSEPFVDARRFLTAAVAAADYHPTSGGSSAPGAAIPAGAHLAMIAQALGLAGVAANAANEAAVNIIVTHESGWNPNAENNSDSNAAAGDPSRGLMQCIMSTFNAYRLPSLPNDIFNGLSNMVAGIRYAESRYGTVVTAGVRSVESGGGYIGYDTGGVLPPGYTNMFNGTGQPELVLNPAQIDAVFGGGSGGGGSKGGDVILGPGSMPVNITVTGTPGAMPAEMISAAVDDGITSAFEKIHIAVAAAGATGH